MKDWKILVVEDEYDGQQVVSKMLEYMGVQSEVASTAEEALHKMGMQTFTAAVIDLALPGMDGLALLSRIRSTPATAAMPCVIITAYHTSAVKQQALAAGANAYFPKPLDDTMFMREFERLLAN